MSMHIPVMLEESLALFKEKAITTFFDGTLGAGGFAHAMLSTHPEIKTYVACDRDPTAIELAKEKLSEFEGKVDFVHSNFSDVCSILKEKGLDHVDGFFLT